MQLKKAGVIYNKSNFLKENGIEIYSRENVKKYKLVLLKMQFKKCLIVTNKKAYLQKIDDIVSDYNNAIHSPRKKRPINIIPDVVLNIILV